MDTNPFAIAEIISTTILQAVLESNTQTEYRRPLIAYTPADNPLFKRLRELVTPQHMLPQDLLPDAVSVVSFFIPFAPQVVVSNVGNKEKASPEWAKAYIETNALIGYITRQIINTLAEQGIQAATVPATHNFDPVTLISKWGHKSIAVVAGLGSFGLNQLVITDAGCAGRFGSLVLDAKLPYTNLKPKERCLYFYDGSCQECVWSCPVGALQQEKYLDKQLCWQQCQKNEQEYLSLGKADVCGKCSTGPCAYESPI